MEGGRASPKRLCYFKEEELDRLLSLPACPHLLLTHDWPTWPQGVHPPTAAHAAKPEGMLLEGLRPGYHLRGHHHRLPAFPVGTTEVRALNIVTREDHAGTGARSHAVNPGWAMLFEWTPPPATSGGGDGRLVELGFWPPVPALSPFTNP